jgi:hypothetical protein
MRTAFNVAKPHLRTAAKSAMDEAVQNVTARISSAFLPKEDNTASQEGRGRKRKRKATAIRRKPAIKKRRGTTAADNFPDIF